jgi:hypothetical protein
VEEKKETCWNLLRKRTETKRIFESLSLANIVGLLTTEFQSSSRSILLLTECIGLLKRSAKYANKTSAVIVQQLNKNATQQLWLSRQVADNDATAILVANSSHVVVRTG